MSQTAHADRQHALLSASGSNRWLTCTPSARLEDQYEDKNTFYTAEGELAHEIAELKLRKYFVEPIGKGEYTKQLNKLKKKEFNGEKLYQKEMLKHTETYLDYLKDISNSMKSLPYVAVEKRVNYSAYAPEGFGTADCIMIGGDTLYVNDFKYGKGVPVSADDNPQMKLYALGAYQAYSFIYPIQNVQIAIVQPRIDNISEYQLSADDLLQWGEEIKPIAQKAFAGEGDFVPGDHCKFCKVKATCRARKESFDPLDDFQQLEPPLLSDDEVGDALAKAKNLKNWLKALEEYALTESLKGKEIKGWKAVEGRGKRDYKDVDKAFEHLKENGIKEAMLYDRVPLTVPKLEKQLGKKQYRELLEEPKHVEKLAGKPTLAPADDKRQAVTNEVSAEEDFK